MASKIAWSDTDGSKSDRLSRTEAWKICTSWVTMPTRSAQTGDGDLTHVDVVEFDRAGVDVIEPKKQAREGRLARAGAPQQAKHLARLQ